MIPCWVKQATTFITSNAFTIQTGPDGSSASNFFPVSLTKTLLGLAYLQHLWRLIGSNPKKQWFWWDTRTKPGLGYKYVLNYIVLFLFIHNICKCMYTYILCVFIYQFIYYTSKSYSFPHPHLPPLSNLYELQPTWLLRTPKAREIQGQVQHQGSIVEDSVTAMHLVIGIFICMDPVEPVS